MVKLKVFIRYFIYAVLILAAWISANSIDDSSYDDLGIFDKLRQVPDNENGYQVIRYLDESSGEIFEKNVRDRIQFHVKGKEWDQDFVDHVLIEHSSLLDDIEAATQRPYFKFPELESVYDIPSYMAIIDSSRLLILRSKNQARKGNIDAALETVKVALTFGQQIKAEENATLISYMIGWAMHYEQLSWIHLFSQQKNISIKHLTELEAALNIIPPYQEDGFNKIIYGEYKFLVRSLEEERNRFFIQRWEEYGLLECGQSNFDCLLLAIFRSYYFHPNEFLGQIAPGMIELADQSPKFCNDIVYISNSWEGSWLAIFLPNSMTKKSIEEGTEHYKSYFSRRCVSYTYLDAVKAIIAAQQYKIINGEIPNTFDTLVPEFVEKHPTDYSDGSKLKYSKETSRLYSVGVDLKTDAGSSNEVNECYTGEACVDNFSIQISQESNNASGNL